MSKWSKEDRVSYNKSEVFQELERLTIDNIYRLDLIVKKANALNPQAIKDLGNAAKEAIPAIKELKQTMNNTEDHLSENDTDDIELESNVVDELNKIKEAALKEGNIKLVYKVERALDEILSVEVP